MYGIDHTLHLVMDWALTFMATAVAAPTRLLVCNDDKLDEHFQHAHTCTHIGIATCM